MDQRISSKNSSERVYAVTKKVSRAGKNLTTNVQGVDRKC